MTLYPVAADFFLKATVMIIPVYTIVATVMFTVLLMIILMYINYTIVANVIYTQVNQLHIYILICKDFCTIIYSLTALIVVGNYLFIYLLQ